MSFYLKDEKNQYRNIDDFSKAAKSEGYKFFEWNGEIFFQDKRIEKSSLCLNSNDGLSDRFIFNTNHKSWTIEKARKAMNDSGYPFMTWNGRVYDKDLVEAGLYSSIVQSEESSKKFKVR